MLPRPAFPRLLRSRLFAVALALAAGAPAGGALAQDLFSDLFGGIFGERRRTERPSQFRRDRESWPARRIAPHSQPRSLPRTHAYGREEPAKPHEKARSEIDFHVAVMGDSFAQMLADELDENFADNPKIGVLRKGKENSGLVRSDYYDWVKAAQEIAEGEQKPSVAVIMIGGNDRQALDAETQSAEPLSPRWREIYGSRVESLIRSFQERNIPVVWVGLPVMKPGRYAEAIAQINEIFRSSAAKAGVPFIDLWDKFADEHGQFNAFGPDVNGQIVRLRSSDGVYFTRAGGRKLAHFVADEIRRLYDARESTGAQPATPVAPEAPAPASAPPVVFQPPAETASPVAAPTLPPERPAIGQTQQLTGAGGANGDDLARRVKTPARDKGAPIERAVAEHVFLKGGDQPARPGRADDFAFRAKPPNPAASP